MKPARRDVNTKTALPSCLQDRAGWARYLDMRRYQEPHLHQIEPTNHCPYSCLMCPRKKMTREKGYMDMSLFTQVIDEVATYAQPMRSMDIELFHFGESLLHPELPEMIAYASGLGLNPVLSVNAPELGPELAEKILDARPKTLIVSLDGVDEENAKTIRSAHLDFRQGLSNVDALIRIHEKKKSPAQILVRMIEIKANASESDRFLETFKSKGIKAEIRKFFPWGEKDLVSLGSFEKYPRGMPCPYPWQYLVVQWNGDVVPCCRDYDAKNKVGNANHQSLKEIWNSPAYEAFRQQHRTGDYSGNPTCEACMDIYYTPDDSRSRDLRE